MPQTVRQILSGESEDDHLKTPLSRSLKKMRKIASLVDRLVGAVRRDEDGASEDWCLIYKAIHDKDRSDHLVLQTKMALDVAGLSFPEYHDPDRSYRQDSLAWISAFREKIAEMERSRERELDQD